MNDLEVKTINLVTISPQLVKVLSGSPMGILRRITNYRELLTYFYGKSSQQMFVTLILNPKCLEM
jgi:hypothetical protein